MRCMHEAQMHEVNSFVTLTYREEDLPAGGELVHRDFQLFMKKLRKRAAARFFMCGEYGEENGRPHFHAILFGVHFADRKYWRRTDSGHACYRSDALEAIWTHGSSEIGSVTFESAAYIASYGLKWRDGQWALLPSGHRVDLESGELMMRKPAYMRCSLRPGIGATWLKRFKPDVVNFDHVVRDGVSLKVPRYYDKLLEREDPELVRQLKLSREEKAMEFDLDVDRLSAAERIAKSRLLKRKL